MTDAFVQAAPVWTGVAYPVSRLVYTLLFMLLVVVGAVTGVRARTTNKLMSEIATTLGIFLLVIGAIVYTVAFRGLRLSEMVVSWTLSGGAIAWFLRRMHAITAEETTQKRDAAVNASEARFQSIIENAAEVLSIVNFDGTRRYVSPAVSRILGFEPHEIEGSHAFDILEEGDRGRALEMFAEVSAEHGNVRSGEFHYGHKDGTSRILAITAKNLGDVAGVEGVVVNMRDVTPQKTLEEQLQQAQKMETVGQLAGGIAHDFNNLLTAIIGRTEFLTQSTNLDTDQREDVDEIRRAAERAGSLTRQLLAFSRKQLLVPRVLNLNQIVIDTGPMLRRLIGEDVRIDTIRQEDLGNIVADSGQIQQVLLNLALNARDAMPAGGLLTIETANADPQHPVGPAGHEPQGEFVMLRIVDTGEGMDARIKAHLFEPFFTTKPMGKGTGLGLSTVYGIIKQSGATIEVDSSVGHGTTFRIYFPRTDAEVASPDVEQGETSPCGTERILLVEDDDSVRLLAERILAEKGYRVTIARSGSTAMKIFDGAPDEIDLVLTDLIMPEMSGREMMERLHHVRPRLRVLYMSGYTDDEIVRRGLHDPTVWFLQKPFTGAELLTKVRQVIEGAERDPMFMPATREITTV
jgi:two-component system, cell cycle sensor histidine kinase and response regulator CckA